MSKAHPSVTVRPCQPGDVEHVAAHMREADVDEVWASSASRPLEAVARSVENSEKVWTLVYGDEPVAIFGVVRKSYLSNVGVPWLLGTSKIVDHVPAFLRLSKVYIPIMADGYARLENYVDFRNKLSIRWLQWMGFSIGHLVPSLVLGVKFHRFYMETKKLCATPLPQPSS